MANACCRTEDGKPVEKTVSIPIVWKLTGK